MKHQKDVAANCGHIASSILFPFKEAQDKAFLFQVLHCTLAGPECIRCSSFPATFGCANNLARMYVPQP